MTRKNREIFSTDLPAGDRELEQYFVVEDGVEGCYSNPFLSRVSDYIKDCIEEGGEDFTIIKGIRQELEIIPQRDSIIKINGKEY